MVPDNREALRVKVSPGEVGIEVVAVALAVFSPIRTIITSGEHEVVSETETVVPRLTPPDVLPSSDSAEVDVLKFAVSVMGLFMVIEAGLAEPVKEPAPVPVQLLNVNPPLGEAEIETRVPASYHPASPEIVEGVTATELPPLAGEF